MGKGGPRDKDHPDEELVVQFILADLEEIDRQNKEGGTASLAGPPTSHLSPTSCLFPPSKAPYDGTKGDTQSASHQQSHSNRHEQLLDDKNNNESPREKDADEELVVQMILADLE